MIIKSLKRKKENIYYKHHIIEEFTRLIIKGKNH